MPRSAMHGVRRPSSSYRWTMTSVSLVRREAVAAPQQLAPKLSVVVDLAVEDELHASRPRSPSAACPPRDPSRSGGACRATPPATRSGPPRSGPRCTIAAHMSRRTAARSLQTGHAGESGDAAHAALTWRTRRSRHERLGRRDDQAALLDSSSSCRTTSVITHMMITVQDEEGHVCHRAEHGADEEAERCRRDR